MDLFSLVQYCIGIFICTNICFSLLDLIICSSIGENEFQHKQYTERFFTLCQNVKKVNKVIDERHESLLYLIETYPGSAKGSTIDSICLCDSRFGDKSTRAFICNWPLNKERASLENLGNSLPSTKANTLDNVLGLPEDYAFPPGKFMPLAQQRY